jgi:type II secretory pathway pseudopilin PulG
MIRGAAKRGYGMFPVLKKHPGSGFAKPAGGAKRGMTLIEVVLAFGILAVALVSTMSLVMTMVEQTKKSALEVSAYQTINEQVEMLRTLSESDAEVGETKPYAVLRRFQEAFGDKVDSFGPHAANLPVLEMDDAEGGMVYRFWVPAPGQSRWLEDDPRFKKNHLAVGKVIFYLDEYKVNHTVLPMLGRGALWRSLDDESGVTPIGFDLNLDGVINASAGMLTNLRDDLVQLPIKAEAVYYATAEHETEVYRISRYALVADITDPTEDFEPPRNESGGP